MEGKRRTGTRKEAIAFGNQNAGSNRISLFSYYINSLLLTGVLFLFEEKNLLLF
jgi:hypothetical protein